MNYFAHGRHCLDRPYVLAGTAVPDWLGACDRKARVRRRAAAARREPPSDPVESEILEVCEGIVRHIDDDDWFHRTVAFVEVSGLLSSRIRDCFPEDRSMRAGFLGHVLTEILLDAVLIAREPSALVAYYAALEAVVPELVESAVNSMNRKATNRLAPLIHRFRQVRFLTGYNEDHELVYRLNQVMRRVRLAPLPDSFRALLPDFRERVGQRANELLTMPHVVLTGTAHTAP
jgi:hypothetical protein